VTLSTAPEKFIAVHNYEGSGLLRRRKPTIGSKAERFPSGFSYLRWVSRPARRLTNAFALRMRRRV
jgi:hypothetical protein